MTTTIESCRFHVRHAWFNVKEQFSDLPSAIGANIVVPFFVWLLSRVWERFNGSQGNFTLGEIVVYIGITELLFMTFVRPNSIGRASGDFSIGLARPRSWIAMSFSGIVGRALGGRLLMLCILIAAFPFLGAAPEVSLRATGRLFFLLPVLTLMQGLFALFFATAQVLWHQTNYFLLPFGKIFLVLGGVWGPIADFNDPWRKWLLYLPPSDLFFQPAYFCVKGQFYGMSATEWGVRIAGIAAVLFAVNIAFFRIAKDRHQSYGG